MPPVRPESAAIVIVATARALKMHGGTALADLKNTDVAAPEKGLGKPRRPSGRRRHYKRPVVVAVNKFFDDSQEELDAIMEHCAERHPLRHCGHLFPRRKAGRNWPKSW